MPFRFAFIVAAFVVALLPPLGAASVDALLDGLKALPGSVEEVRVGGTWERDGRSGVYRVIVSRSGGDEITARLFIQWVAYGDMGDAAVADTIEIPEFAALNLDIVDFTTESDNRGLEVFIQTLDPNGSGSDLNYELIVNSPTQYRFRPASN
jgi:hypothetical protein